MLLNILGEKHIGHERYNGERTHSIPKWNNMLFDMYNIMTSNYVWFNNNNNFEAAFYTLSSCGVIVKEREHD